MKIVYAIGTFYRDTHQFAANGTLDSEKEARRYCESGTRETGDRKAMKIVRQEAGAASGDVIAFYMRGVEVPYEETIKNG